MGAKHLDQSLIFGSILVKASELVSARAESTTRGRHESFNCAAAFSRGIDQLFFQRADNPVFSREDFAKVSGVRSGGLDNASGRGVDNGCDAAGLGVEEIALTHAELLGWPVRKCVP